MTTTADPREVARWARIVTANRLISLDSQTWRNTGKGGSTFGGDEFCTPVGKLADAFEELAMGVDAREVARWLTVQGWAYAGTGLLDPAKCGIGNIDSKGRHWGVSDQGWISRRLNNLHPGDPMPDLLTTTPPPRRCAIPLMVELCAGTAALSLRLERAKARPPVSRMGAKTGYADVILALAGLNPGDKAEEYYWCEPDDGVRLLLHAYRDAELAREAAAIIRGWADEEPRALWERLRAEGPAVCPPVDALEVGRWLNSEAWTMSTAVPLYSGPGRQNGVCKWQTSEGLAARTADQGDIPATIHDDARTLDPCPGECWPRHDSLDEALGCMRCQRASERSRAGAVQVPPGTLAYIDPPYLNTTGYAHDLPRAAVVAQAAKWGNAGARCMVSEAEPIPELMADGWHAVEITAMRQGQKRTFSKQQAEWVTMNFEPDFRARLVCERALERLTMREAATVGGEQADLFGGA